MERIRADPQRLWESFPRAALIGDQDVLDWAALAGTADAAVVSLEQADGADQSLRAALEQAGRAHTDVALIGRVQVRSGGGDAAELAIPAG